MPEHDTTSTRLAACGRRRPARASDLLGQAGYHRAAETTEDARAARELMDALLALVDAGRIAPVHRHGAVRYAPSDPTALDQRGVDGPR